MEVNEASFMGPTSITSSDLGLLFKDMVFAQIDDILGGQGSDALGDYAADLEMGEQNREEVESREQPPPQPSPTADRGKGLANNDAEVPNRLFPVTYPIEEVYNPLLNAIVWAVPKTFARFNPWTPQLESMLLRALHDLLMPWAQLRFSEFTLAMETAIQGLMQDMVNLDFDLGWLSNRGSRAQGRRRASSSVA